LKAVIILILSHTARRHLLYQNRQLPLSLSHMKAILILPLSSLFILLSFVGAAQTCTISCPENVLAKADSGAGGTHINLPSAIANTDCGAITYTPASGSFFKIGSSSVIVTSASGQRCSFTVTVTDNEPPTLSPIVLSAKRLWPANGRMRDVSVRYTSADNSNETSCVITVSSNDSASSGNDWEVVDEHNIKLKASRLRNGMARVYVISVTCTDPAGNITKRTTGISVAKNISETKTR
jgi:hypothetical protein